MPKIDLGSVPSRATSIYPDQFRHVTEGRSRKRLGDMVGLTQFGVNVCTLKPGAASSLRHRHETEDELVFILEGEVVLVEDDGETVLRRGDAAGWKAGSPVHHQLVNRSKHDALVLEIGTRAARDRVEYADADLLVHKGADGIVRMHKSGEVYGPSA